MARTISVGIDLGTAVTRCVVLSYTQDAGAPETLAAVSIPSRGLRHGYIVNPSDAAASIRHVASLAEKEAGIPIKKATFSMGGVSLASEHAIGSAIVSKADGEVTSFDLKAALQSAEEALELKNRRILHTSVVSWRLDGKEVPGKAEGMHGVKLEVKMLFVTCLSQHLDDLLSAAGEAGIEVLDVIPASVSASSIALSDRQRTVGVMLVNIGAETVSVAVFENNSLIGMVVLPLGSTDITNDIALGFRIGLDEAESIKIGTVTAQAYPKKKIDEIIEARLSDIFELIDKYLKHIKRSGLLPAGVVITGGGAGNALVESLAKDMLRLPSRVGGENFLSNVKSPMRDASWFVAYGAALLGRNADSSARSRLKGQGIKSLFKEFLRQFLP